MGKNELTEHYKQFRGRYRDCLKQGKPSKELERLSGVLSLNLLCLLPRQKQWLVSTFRDFVPRWLPKTEFGKLIAGVHDTLSGYHDGFTSLYVDPFGYRYREKKPHWPKTKGYHPLDSE
jgi:hypothetical protein